MTREDEIKLNARWRADQYDHPAKWSDTYYGFISGAEWADAHPHWISVEDELPKMSYKSGDSDDVIVCLYNGRRDIDSYDYSLEEWVLNNRDVTYWTPLPSLPSSSEFPNNSKKGGNQWNEPQPPTEGIKGNQGKTSPNEEGG